ncbi:Uncharacterised protein [Shigella sonnei]|nr:Uncharacterised protein [Shigella sonnei]
MRLNCSCSSSRRASLSAGMKIRRSYIRARVNNAAPASTFSKIALRINMRMRSSTLSTGTEYTMLSDEGGRFFFSTSSRNPSV